MKFKALLPLIAGLAWAAGAAAQAPSPEPDFSPAAFRSHVAFLADDLLEGRETGSRGYDIAARYVATQFSALGLEPAVAGDWFQPVQLVRYEAVGTPRLALDGPVEALDPLPQ